jgi:hypothetical protein
MRNAAGPKFERASRGLLWVTLRPSPTPDQEAFSGLLLLHELTFCPLRFSSLVPSARNSPLGLTKR